MPLQRRHIKKATMYPFPRFNRARIAFAHDLLMAAISFPLSLYIRVGDLFDFFGGDFVTRFDMHGF